MPNSTSRPRGRRILSDDEDTSSEGEFGAWARTRPPNERRRPPGGSVKLKDRFRANAGPQPGTARGRGAGRNASSMRGRDGARGRGVGGKHGPQSRSESQRLPDTSCLAYYAVTMLSRFHTSTDYSSGTIVTTSRLWHC